MDTQRLKLKIGEHEFEAEGPQDVVQAQYEAFQELVMKVLTATPPPAPNVNQAAQHGATNDLKREDGGNNTPDDQIQHIMEQDKKVVSLTTRTRNVDEAALLIMYGQKLLRNHTSLTGAEIMDGLRQSGVVVPRVDRNLERLSDAGYVIVTGQNRAKRYRLTNSGLARAREVATERIAEVA